MLTLTIKENSYWDSNTEQFIYVDDIVINIEHSLLSIAEWESKYHKPFLSSKKSNEELFDYIWFMYSTVKNNDNKFERWMVEVLPNDILRLIKNYIDDPRTASKIIDEDEKNKKPREFVTNELIYYWMKSFGLPFETCEKWHINRLITLLRICSAKEKSPKKKSMKERYEDNIRINEQNKAYFEALKNKKDK